MEVFECAQPCTTAAEVAAGGGVAAYLLKGKGPATGSHSDIDRQGLTTLL